MSPTKPSLVSDSLQEKENSNCPTKLPSEQTTQIVDEQPLQPTSEDCKEALHSETQYCDSNDNKEKLLSQSSSSQSNLISKSFVEETKSEHSLIKKTSGYFQKAEQLVNRFLNKEMKLVQKRKSSMPNGPNKSTLLFHDPYLKSYQVIGFCGKVIVATDVCTQEKVAIKVIEYSGGDRRRDRCTIPSEVPFMAPLLRMHEADCALYLVIKYVSGGKLWDHLKNYIKEPPSSLSNDKSTASCLKQIYTGHRVILDECNKLNPHVYKDNKDQSSRDVSNSVPFADLNLALSECRSTVAPPVQPMAVQNQRLMSSLSSLVPLPIISYQLPHELVNPLSVTENSSLVRSRLKSKSLDALNDERVSDQLESIYEKKDASDGSGTLSGISEDFGCSSEDLIDQQDFSVKTEGCEKPIDVVYNDKLFDIDNIIKNSRRLLENVNQTLEKSKQQVLKRVSLSEIEDLNQHVSDRKSSFTSEEISSIPPEESLVVPYSSDIPLTLASVLDKYKTSHSSSLPEGLVRVWLSQVVAAMEALHNQGLVWGDFNPSNILLEEGGGILLTYYGDWALDHNRKRYFHYYREEFGRSYVAPELSSPLASLTFAADWWSLGALLFHFVTGQDLCSAHPSGINSHTKVEVPTHVSSEATSLIEKLLCAHPSERLGGSHAGAQEIKDHPFFFGIQWSS